MEVRKIKLPFRIKNPVLAMGAQTKNRLCLARGGFAYLSPVHKDLANPRDFSAFEKAVKYFLKKHPKIIACDLHPEYQSTKYARNLSPITYHLSPIQHHHAHIASCMADNGLENQKVIGVAFDGTGLGSDNTLWGAEFLVCGYKNFKRAAHLKEIPLLGGERAILEPWRLAAIWLYSAYGDKFLNLKVDFIKKINKKKWKILKDMYLKKINSPLASSMGRLFDAAASLLLVKYKADSEAELAIGLEGLAQGARHGAAGYKFRVNKSKDKYIIDPLAVFREIISDLKNSVPKEEIAYKFHLTVAEMIRKTCLVLRKKTKINKIVLSGGVFQNKVLLRLSLGLLYKEGFEVLTRKSLSCNDSGISLGQAVIAGGPAKHLN